MSRPLHDPPKAAEASATYLASLGGDRPTPEAQVDFLGKVQRIFTEGEFQATYKFALLIALAELAVERGSDDLRPLPLQVDWIAEKFAELYWPQTMVYSSGARSAAGVLAQNYGATARVVSVLLGHRQRTGAATIAAARRADGWTQALRAIARTVRGQPLTYLQNVGGETVPFIYRFPEERGWIELLPGVAANLRRFNGLIGQLARASWVRHVRENPLNVEAIGAAGDLEAFMFGIGRTTLEPARDILAKLQSRRCFYCHESMGASGDVDHFVPWSKYPRDLAHNLVLAHAECNRSKSDSLAGLAHLEHWLQRNVDHRDAIAGELSARGFIVDSDGSTVVARWAYGQAAVVGGRAWNRASQWEPVGEQHLAALSSIA